MALILTIFFIWLLSKHYEIQINLQSESFRTLTVFLIIFLTIIFWGIHLTLSSDKDPDRYSKHWGKGNIVVSILVNTIAMVVTMLCMINNISKENYFLKNIYILLIILIICNIANGIILRKMNSKTFVIVDSLLLQIRVIRNAAVIIFLIMLSIKMTVIGFIIFCILIAIALDIFCN